MKEITQEATVQKPQPVMQTQTSQPQAVRTLAEQWQYQSRPQPPQYAEVFAQDAGYQKTYPVQRAYVKKEFIPMSLTGFVLVVLSFIVLITWLPGLICCIKAKNNAANDEKGVKLAKSGIELAIIWICVILLPVLIYLIILLVSAIALASANPYY